MLANYEKDFDGVIYQVDYQTFTYDKKYPERYNNYGSLPDKMSYLRLGHMIGSIGKIPNSILDVGYGNGSFLSACSTTIKNCFGHDITNYPLPKNCTFVENMFSLSFDVITFFDSLEHFPDIEWVKDLKTNFVVISVPHCHYFSDEWFYEWKHRRPDEHLWHFNKDSLKKFMDRMGYNMIASSNVEDVIRKNKIDEENILTSIFEKR